MEQKISLTSRQQWFLKCAIEKKDWILPFNALDENSFEDDYGITKKSMEKEIKDLKKKLK